MTKVFYSSLIHRFLTLVLVTSLVIGLAPSRLVFADGLDKLYVTPTSGQPYVGNTFPVTVGSYSDTDDSVGTVAGTVTFPSNLLKVAGISVSGSGYGSPTINQGTGTVSFNGTRNPAPSGIVQVFTITFQAIAAGTATVGFSGDSVVNNSQTQYTTGTFTIVNPNPAPTPAPPKPSPKPSVSVPSPVATPAPTPSVAPTTIDNSVPQPTPDPTGVVDSVNVSALYNNGSVTWKVNADNPTSTLAYGSDTSQMTQSAPVTKNADGTFTAKLTDLSPGVRYYFAITGSGGGKNGTYNGTIVAQGYPVALTITENNVPVKSGTVKIGDQSYPIGADGKLTIGLASGSYSMTTTTSTASLTQTITVATKKIPADGSAPELQTFAVGLTSSPLEQGPGSGFSILGFVGVLLGGTAFLAVGFVGFMAYRRRKFESGTSTSFGPTVIVEDGYDWRNEAKAAGTLNEEAAAPPPVIPDAGRMPLHNNSVHLSEEEPLDMFDRAAALPLPPAHSVSSPGTAPGQSPNVPHSTTT